PPPAVAVRPLPDTTALAREESAPPPPLMLKASRWSGNGGIRTASQLNPSVADTATNAAAVSLSPNSTSRGTP
ncbi:MAG TPA: hypothetical protein VF555_11925, partial [Variovorax sp.]